MSFGVNFYEFITDKINVTRRDFNVNFEHQKTILNRISEFLR